MKHWTRHMLNISGLIAVGWLQVQMSKLLSLVWVCVALRLKHAQVKHPQVEFIVVPSGVSVSRCSASVCTAPVCVCVVLLLSSAVPLRVSHVFTFIIMHLFIRVHQRNTPVLVAHSSASFTFFILFRDKLHDVYGLIFLSDWATTGALVRFKLCIQTENDPSRSFSIKKKMLLDWWFPGFQSHSSWEFHLNRGFIFARMHFWFFYKHKSAESQILHLNFVFIFSSEHYTTPPNLQWKNKQLKLSININIVKHSIIIHQILLCVKDRAVMLINLFTYSRHF